ncbi:hypothetical protein N9Y42_09830, partial [Mariniblastus sp.]|nr:hypothetical protein [Mariniblastus sp.]
FRTYYMATMLLIVFHLCLSTTSQAQTNTESIAQLTVRPSKTRQTFNGMGCGSIFYSGHLASFKNKPELQTQLFDDVFTNVRTDFLHLMIRPDFEPENDNEDPYNADFKEDNFAKNKNAIKVCREAKKRRPDMKLYATLYTPPSWMKTNGEPSGGAKKKATIIDGMELECAEYIWGYLQHMAEKKQPIDYLSISNEPDWGHHQPGYFLTPKQHAALFEIVAEYLEDMYKMHPEVPRAKLVVPNGISAVNAAKKFLPALSPKASKLVDVIGSHDYDRRPGRWAKLRELAGERPVWCTEWCWNGKDKSPDMIQAANSSWSVMTDGFNGGVNVWMAYEWVYPPRDGGEALTHVDWGKSYHHTKVYYAFKQWTNALSPGMKVVATSMQAPEVNVVTAVGGVKKNKEPGVKACAFIGEVFSDDSKSSEQTKLVIHVVNLQKQPSEFAMQIEGEQFRNAEVKVLRTDQEVSIEPGEPMKLSNGILTDRLAPWGLVTYELQVKQ